MTQTPPPETSGADASSRRDRLVARRGRRTRFAVIVLAVAILGAAGAGAYAAYANDPPAHAAGTSDPKPTSFAQGTLVPAGAATYVPPRAVSHADPLNLWIGGDSLAGSFGPALGDQVGATGVVKTVIDYKVSSGLWSNDIRDWNARATEQMASDNPDAVVFIIGTNDTDIVNKVDANGDGVPDWEAIYRLKVDRMMQLLVGPKHRTVFWLGPPTLGMDNLNSGAKAIDALMKQEAAKYAPDVTYLDTYKLFSDNDGGYARSIVDDAGKLIEARISDGVHFTEDGAQYLARAVFALVDARWHLTKQADLKEPIGWTLAAGSGESVPGFSSAPRSRYGSGSGSGSQSQYTPSTNGYVTPSTGVPESSTVGTVAPTTSPPTTPSTVAVTPTTAHPPPTTVHAPPTTVHTPTT